MGHRLAADSGLVALPMANKRRAINQTVPSTVPFLVLAPDNPAPSASGITDALRMDFDEIHNST